jgi:hypothetical protein
MGGMGGTGVVWGIYTRITKYSKRSAIIYGWIHIPNNIVRIGHNTAFEGRFELLAHGAISFRCPTNSISDQI